MTQTILRRNNNTFNSDLTLHRCIHIRIRILPLPLVSFAPLLVLRAISAFHVLQPLAISAVHVLQLLAISAFHALPPLSGASGPAPLLLFFVDAPAQALAAVVFPPPVFFFVPVCEVWLVQQPPLLPSNGDLFLPVAVFPPVEMLPVLPPIFFVPQPLLRLEPKIVSPGFVMHEFQAENDLICCYILSLLFPI